MSRFWKTVTQWLVALLLGAFLFQALAASASELCRLQCQKDWKANAASIGESQGELTEKWSLLSTPCPDLPVGSDSASAEDNACNACGMCVLNPVFALQQVRTQMDEKHPPRPFLEPLRVQVWLNDGLFKPPRA